jgi:menaquinone-dependent protoporphyrinogen IX oxidase
MTKPVLVAYTTYSGSTHEVAEAIAEELGKCGATVEVHTLDAVSSLDGYVAAVIGAPMILGWHRLARRFVHQHAAALSKLPVAYFVTAMSLTQSGETQVDGIPVSIDPGLAEAPKRPGKLSLHERYTQVKRYVRPILHAAAGVKPVSVALFKGRLEFYRLKILPMLFTMLVIRAQPGDYRNWSFIRAWGAGLYPLLGLDHPESE